MCCPRIACYYIANKPCNPLTLQKQFCVRRSARGSRSMESVHRFAKFSRAIFQPMMLGLATAFATTVCVSSAAWSEHEHTDPKPHHPHHYLDPSPHYEWMKVHM